MMLFVLLLVSITPVVSIKCYECGYGEELDLVRFPQIFGQEKFSFSLSKTSANYDKWCGKSAKGQNESLVECEGGCALVRVTDGLSAIAGCAEVNDAKVETSYSVARVGKSQFEMFICNRDACNENPERARSAQKAHDKQQPASAASTASLFSAFVLVLIVFFVNNGA
ncbi:hypothetical protein M3Y99_00417400 [Aphelenchoides fujianensis]|nr:hypothetical protein M3Y99_00417400 [Aphelenchoides fujianensis]